MRSRPLTHRKPPSAVGTRRRQRPAPALSADSRILRIGRSDRGSRPSVRCRSSLQLVAPTCEARMSYETTPENSCLASWLPPCFNFCSTCTYICHFFAKNAEFTEESKMLTLYRSLWQYCCKSLCNLSTMLYIASRKAFGKQTKVVR